MIAVHRPHGAQSSRDRGTQRGAHRRLRPDRAGSGDPHRSGCTDVALIQLFDKTGGELTFDVPLFSDNTLRIDVRMCAPDGHQITEVTGGAVARFSFTPASLVVGHHAGGRAASRSDCSLGVARVTLPG